MKKLIIISGIVLGVCIIVLVCVFGIHALIQSNKNLNSNIVSGTETTNDEGDDTGENVNDKLFFTVIDFEVQVGEIVDLAKTNCFTSTNLKAFNVLITSENNCLVIDGLKFKAVKECIADVKVLSKLKTETEFKTLGSFNVVAYQKFDETAFKYKTEFCAINECELTITFNEGVNFNLINLAYSKSLSLIEPRKDKADGITLKLAIENSLTGYVYFSYKKNMYSDEVVFLKEIELKQELQYFKLYNETTATNNLESVHLFVTRNGENFGEVFAYNNIRITNGLAIEKAVYNFVALNNCVEILKSDEVYRITAKNVGKAKILVKYGEVVLYEFEANVSGVEVETVTKRSEAFSVYEGESVDISPLEILPSYAPYEIAYKCLSENASISPSGIFVSNIADVYSVEVCINELSYYVTITVTKKVAEKFFDICKQVDDEVYVLTEYECNVNDYEFFTLSFGSGSEPVGDGVITYLIAEIDGKINNDIVDIECVDLDVVKILFKKKGEYALILKIKGTIYRSKPINLKIN